MLCGGRGVFLRMEGWGSWGTPGAGCTGGARLWCDLEEGGGVDVGAGGLGIPSLLAVERPKSSYPFASIDPRDVDPREELGSQETHHVAITLCGGWGRGVVECVEGGKSGVLLLPFAPHQLTAPPHARSAAHSPCAAVRCKKRN